MLSMVRTVFLGECGGGGNLPEERRLGIMLPLLLLLPPPDAVDVFASAEVSSSVLATGEGGLGCIMDGDFFDASSRSRLLVLDDDVLLLLLPSCCCLELVADPPLATAVAASFE